MVVLWYNCCVTKGCDNVMNNKQVQEIAKTTMEYAKQNINPGMSLLEVRKMCEDKLIELGADSFWYYNIGAFIFNDTDTTTSISGRKYSTTNSTIKENDIITIDLSPQINKVWGDYARTIIIENGKVVQSIDNITNDEWRLGLQMEDTLHSIMSDFVTPNTTFEELFYYINNYITAHGYVNLDFLGNLGHSIVNRKYKRTYIEKGNKKKLGSVAAFTFEPHISCKDSKYGFKKENIYYFDNGKLKEL